MLFNSIDFAIFLPIVFTLYWLIPSKKVFYQNMFLVCMSYFFYAWWDWRFLFLIVFSSLVDFISGKKIYSSKSDINKKVWLLVSLLTNIGMLGFFKYFNFFIDSLNNSFQLFGNDIRISNLNIVLPVGISFYTFQTISYSIDIYREKMKPTGNLVMFLGYVGFFPQLVAGPIERAIRLLPQFSVQRKFDYLKVTSGFKQLVWGLFKKVAIADSCGIYVDEIFANYQQYNSLILLMGLFFFSIQIYADFSGYSDIAIGVARMFGFNLMVNFKMPNFSRDVAEYWRRWHVSLSTWFKDYVYIPLGGSRGGKWMILRNTLLVFLISGFWHGADWTFVIWGALNGILFLPLILMGKNRKYLNTVAENRILPSFKEGWQVFLTFTLISFTRIFFRSQNIDQAFGYTARLFSFDLSGNWNLVGIERYFFEIIPLVFLFKSYEWIKRHKQDNMISNWVEMAVVLIGIVVFGVFSETENFIYFQF